MIRAKRFALAAAVLWVGIGCAANIARDEDESIGVGRSLLTAEERAERAALIRDVSFERGITQGWLVAGIADAETSMSHCWSELMWACEGPASPDCGDGPVVAGAGDGPCDLLQGGLGMFQFDGGTYDETLAREGDRILLLRGNVDAAVDFILRMVIRSEFIDGVDTEQEAIAWMNGVTPDGDRIDPWAETVTRYYNGCTPTSSCWGTRLPRYLSKAVDLYDEMGADFWLVEPEPMPPPEMMEVSVAGSGCATVGRAARVSGATAAFVAAIGLFVARKRRRS